MNILTYILIVVLAYFFLVFVLFRVIAPFYGFGQYEPPTDLPPKVRQAIADLESKSSDQISYLQAVYNFVTDKTINQWKHTRFKAGTHLAKAFINDLEEIWESEGFVYCTAINFVAYTLIANSKFFSRGEGSGSAGKADNVKVRHVFLNFVTHQYLQVKVGDKWVDFDPAGSGIRGRNLGTHASIFG
jgi:hypothetical protein